MVALGKLPLINDYSLCNQCVTVYHYYNGKVSRTMHPRAYYEMVDTVATDRTGTSGKSEHLIVIPGDNVEVIPGDKVYLGLGPRAVDDAKWWREFIPAKDDNVVIVRSVSPRYWRNAIAHYELRG